MQVATDVSCTSPISLSNRIQVRPLDGAKTGVAEPHIAEQSWSWRAASGVQGVGVNRRPKVPLPPLGGSIA